MCVSTCNVSGILVSIFEKKTVRTFYIIEILNVHIRRNSFARIFSVNGFKLNLKISLHIWTFLVAMGLPTLWEEIKIFDSEKEFHSGIRYVFVVCCSELVLCRFQCPVSYIHLTEKTKHNRWCKVNFRRFLNVCWFIKYLLWKFTLNYYYSAIWYWNFASWGGPYFYLPSKF